MAALPVDHSEVKKRIEELIERDGLETVTSSKIRAHLKSAFDVDFSECKKAVDDITKDVIDNIMSKSKKTSHKDLDSDSDSDDGEPAPSVKEEGTAETPSKPAGDSSSDDSDHGIASSPVKKGKKRKAAEMDTSNMDLMSAIKTGRRAAAKQAANNLKKIGGWKTKEKEGAKKKEPGKITKGSKLVYISEELQEITGQRFMRRCDVVKAMWAYVREHDRMDPKDKRFALIEGDEKLEKVFKGKKRLQMFGVMGHLGHRHLMNPLEISEELVEECEEYKDKLIAEYEARTGGPAPPPVGKTPATGNDSSDEDENEEGKEVKSEEKEEEDDGEEDEKKDEDEESGSSDSD